MNVLLVGGGAREHALAWKLAQSPGLSRLYASPGNPGIADHAECVALNLVNHADAVAWAAAHDIGLVVVGPEAPLVDGLADSLRAAGIAVFGPNRTAAQLEASKAFTKRLCDRAGIPTARYEQVETIEAGLAALDRFGLPVVVKADGLAAGKGVVVARTRGEAENALRDIFESHPSLGEKAVRAPWAAPVIEAFLSGEEVSLFVLTDGETLVPFGSAQDHKRVGDGDTGPNTGGMGAYSPAPVLTPALERRALEEIVAPTVRAMREAGTPFSGVLYAGLMLTAAGPKLIEYNVRFGDPECQVLMARFPGDLLALLLAVAEGRLGQVDAPVFSADTALTVVVAAAGYPGTPRAGGVIRGLDAAEARGATVFQAGTRLDDGALVASGGRVLAVTAMAPNVAGARAAAYSAVDLIDYADGFWRTDIGARAIEG